MVYKTIYLNYQNNSQLSIEFLIKASQMSPDFAFLSLEQNIKIKKVKFKNVSAIIEQKENK